MARRRRGPLVPEAQAGLQELRERLSALKRGESSELPTTSAVARFRELARRYVSTHDVRPPTL